MSTANQSMETPNASMTIPRARRELAFSRSLLRSPKFLPQNRTILCNAVRTNSLLVSSKKHAAQRPEKLRQKPSLNYKLAALPTLATGYRITELCAWSETTFSLFEARGQRVFSAAAVGPTFVARDRMVGSVTSPSTQRRVVLVERNLFRIADFAAPRAEAAVASRRSG